MTDPTPPSAALPDEAPPPSIALPDEARAIARLAAPIALAQVGMVTLGLVDTAVVGRVSVEDLAGTAMARSIFYAAGSLGLGVGLALEPLASQAIGAGEPRRAWSALGATLRASLIVALIALCVSFGVTAALAPCGVDPALVPKVRAFLIGELPGFFLQGLFMTGRTYLQAHGETRPALVAVLAANVVNLVACNLLVRGDAALLELGLPGLGLPQLGALGAGMASSVGQLVLVLIILGAVARRRPEAPDAAIPVRTVLRLGLPVGLQLLAEIGVFSVVALAAGRMGAHVVSAHQIAIGLASLTFMGALGVSGATAVRVGYAVGAGRSPRRPGLIGLVVGGAYMSVSALVFATMPRPLLRIFTPDPQVIELGVPLLGLAAIFQIFDGVQAVAAGALRGAGDVRFPFLANVAAHWAVGFPLAIGLGFWLGLGATGLWVGLTAGLVVISILLTLRFLHLTRGRVARL